MILDLAIVVAIAMVFSGVCGVLAGAWLHARDVADDDELGRRRASKRDAA